LPLPDVEIVGDHFFLAGGLRLRNFHGWDRMSQRVGEFARAVFRAVPAKQAIRDVHIGKEIGDHPGVGIALDVVKKNGQASVEVFLHAGNFEVGVNLHVCLEQIAFSPQPVQRASQAADVLAGFRLCFLPRYLNC